MSRVDSTAHALQLNRVQVEKYGKSIVNFTSLLSGAK